MDNLKEVLINKAIEIISIKGIDNLSMRNLAQECGVSRGAPYVYFENKEEMLKSISDYVSNNLSNILEESIKDKDISDYNTLYYMGYAYINFFKLNPHYYDFIFNNGLFKIVITLDYVEDNFKPFEVFRRACCEIVKAHNIEEKVALGALVRLFSVTQGVAMLESSKNVYYDGNLDDILKYVYSF